MKQDEEKRRKRKKGENKNTKQKGNKKVSSSQISAFPLPSVNVAAKFIIGWKNMQMRGTQGVKLLTEGLPGLTLCKWLCKQGHVTPRTVTMSRQIPPFPKNNHHTMQNMTSYTEWSVTVATDSRQGLTGLIQTHLTGDIDFHIIPLFSFHLSSQKNHFNEFTRSFRYFSAVSWTRENREKLV